MLKKALFAATALVALAAGAAANAADLKEFRIGILGGENEADRLRNYACLSDHLKKEFGSRRFRCSRLPTITALSRACSAARSTSPNSALPATQPSPSRTRRPLPRS